MNHSSGEEMNIGDLVKYRTSTHHDDWGGWLGIIVREIPGNHKLKVVEWVHENKGRDRGSYRPRDLELVSENR
jgi:NADH:ubiquinone oxidoreductase subunit